MNFAWLFSSTLARWVPKSVLVLGAILSLCASSVSQATFMDRCRTALLGESARSGKTEKYIDLLKAELGSEFSAKDWKNSDDVIHDLVGAIFADVYELEKVDQMARKGVAYLAHQNLSKDDKAAIWREMADFMENRTTRGFISDEFVGTDGAAVFQNFDGMALVIAPDGTVYRGNFNPPLDTSIFPRPLWKANYQHLGKVGEAKVTIAK